MARQRDLLLYGAVGAVVYVALTRRYAGAGGPRIIFPNFPVPTRPCTIDPTTGTCVETELPTFPAFPDAGPGGDPFLRGETPPCAYLCQGDPTCIANCEQGLTYSNGPWTPL